MQTREEQKNIKEMRRMSTILHKLMKNQNIKKRKGISNYSTWHEFAIMCSETLIFQKNFQ